MGDLVIFLIGILTCLSIVLIYDIVKKISTRYGEYELIKYTEDGGEFVNLKIIMDDADESLVKSKRIILKRRYSQK